MLINFLVETSLLLLDSQLLGVVEVILHVFVDDEPVGILPILLSNVVTDISSLLLQISHKLIQFDVEAIC